MDPKQEQQEELEILEATYPDEVEVLCRDHPNIKLSVKIPSAPAWETDEPEFLVDLEIKLPAEYPNVSPEFEIIGFPDDFPLKNIEEIYGNMRQQAADMLGFQILITLISEVQNSIPDILKRLEREAEDERKRIEDEKEAAEAKKFEGNRVTVESFNKWRIHFGKDFLAAEIAAKKARESELAGKLTGRQQFLRDATLNMSDLGFLEKQDDAVEEEDENVEIDQALFDEDLGELDLSDSDDEDYKPDE